MRIGNVKIYKTTSNAIIKLAYQNPLVLYNVKIIAINPQMDLTITITDSGGNQWSFSVTTGTEITFKKINYQAITFSDPNNYTIYYSIQAIYADNYQELQQLEQESDISLIPINNVIITSPLDANGNLKVNVEQITQTMGLGANAFTNALTTANAKQALSPPTGYSTIAQAFVILINLSPSDTIYVGDVNNQIIPLAPNQSMALDIHKSQLYFNITTIYWYGATATTDKIGVLYA